MIFDRTSRDIQNAIEIINTKVKNFQTLLDSDLEMLERGCFSISTLNRIEDAVGEIVQKMNDFGGIVTAQTKEWTMGDVFFISDFNRILNNISYLRSKINVSGETPNVPAPEFSYTALNAMEKILFDVKTLLANAEKSFIYSGEIYSGEVN